MNVSVFLVGFSQLVNSSMFATQVDADDIFKIQCSALNRYKWKFKGKKKFPEEFDCSVEEIPNKYGTLELSERERLCYFKKCCNLNIGREYSYGYAVNPLYFGPRWMLPDDTALCEAENFEILSDRKKTLVKKHNYRYHKHMIDRCCNFDRQISL